MTFTTLILPLLFMIPAVAAYRLGLADGLSAGRCGRLADAGKKEGGQDLLLRRIEAYDGRKEPHGTNK